MSSDAPVQVRRAVALMWASLAIGILFTIPALEPVDPEAKEFEAAMWVVTTISFLIPAVLIVFVSRRKNWARVAMLILTIVGIAETSVHDLTYQSHSALVGFIEDNAISSPLARVLRVLGPALLVGVLVIGVVAFWAKSSGVVT
jgi:hypothetical protein